MKGRAPGPFSWLPSSTVAFPRQLPPGEHLERQPWEQPWLCLPRSSAPVGRASPTAGHIHSKEPRLKTGAPRAATWLRQVRAEKAAQGAKVWEDDWLKACARPGQT